MAMTGVKVKEGVPGEAAFVVMDLTMDAAYPAGGYPITPATFGLSSIDFIDVQGVRQGVDASHAVAWEWDHVNSKLKAWKANGATATLGEVANTDLSTASVLRVRVTGRR